MKKNYLQKFFGILYLIIYQLDSLKKTLQSKRKIFKNFSFLGLEIIKIVLSKNVINYCKIIRKSKKCGWRDASSKTRIET